MNKSMRWMEKSIFQRILALAMTVCMMTSMSPPLTAVEASAMDSGNNMLLSGFAPLPQEVAVQNVAIGMPSADLVLPDTLEAYLAESNFGDVVEIPPTPSEPEIIPPATSEPEVIPPATSKQENTESSSAPESAPNEPPSESSEPTVSEPAASEPESAPAEPAISEDTPIADEPVTQVLSAYVESGIAETDDEATTPAAVTIEGVTWTSTPAFDGNAAGTYIFTAILPDGYTVEEGVAMPPITVTVGHILEHGDCMDFTCATHYPPEVLAEMNEDETPVPLTLSDLVEDYGIETPAPRRTRAAANPQTLMVTKDNENNAHTGKADGDMDEFLYSIDSNHPIEVAFTIPADKMPTQNAYLAVKAYDVDEDYVGSQAPEHDYVYINDDIFLPRDSVKPNAPENRYNLATIGYLSGTNNTWNTTVLEIPLEKLKPGKNVISITVAPMGWVVKVDWMQLVLDGGEKDPNIESFSLTLGEPVNSSSTVQIPATVTIKQKGTTKYVTEYSLIQTATGNALDAKFGKAQTQETVSLSMPQNSQTGIYKITGILKDPVTEEIKASDEVLFEFIQNMGAVIAPKMTHTLTPSGLTNQNVAIAVSVANANGCTDISIQDSGARTVTANGDYAFTVNYKYNGTAKTLTYTVPVTNIDKTPPVIAYTAFTVMEETGDTEVANLFKTALTATDNNQLASGPTYTLPANIAATPGAKNVTVTATDAAGNTASKICAITVTPLPLTLAQNNPARVGASNSFTLSAKITNTGGDSITETGFVWGAMQSPTTAVNNGKTKTASAVTSKGGTISVTAADIADGVNYYARPYAIAGAKTYYGDQKPFSIGGKSYGSFTVKNNGDSTFTITRTGGADDVQTVYYRTVNGSAVGGTHITHAASTVRFAAGETSKTVTVIEWNVNAPYDRRPATAFSNANRSYQLEIYKVEGGGTITGGVSRATRTMTGNTTVSKTIYAQKNTTRTIDTNNNYVCDRDNKPDGNKGGSDDGAVYFLTDRAYNIGLETGYGKPNWSAENSIDALYSLPESDYIKNTAQSYNYNATYTGTEKDDGWELVWVGTHIPNTYGPPAKTMSTTNYNSGARTLDPNDADLGPAMYTGTFEIKSAGQGFTIPMTTGMANYSYGNGQSNGSTVLNVPIRNTTYCYFSACGGNVDVWQVNSFSDTVQVIDTKEPQLVGVAPMAGGTYKPGDSVTISLVFDEIVDSVNSPNISAVTLNTSYGTMAYAGGVDTNVLYFTGTVPEGASGTVTVNSINNVANIKDMCDQTGTNSGGSGSGSITVDNVQPTVSIAKTPITSGTAKGTISASNHTSLKYTWTQSDTMPVGGWISCTSGYTAQTRQTSGKWYLHALAERSDNGSSKYASAEFDFGTPENPTSPLPTLAVSADNTSWAHSRNITVTRTPPNATVTYTGPQSGTATGGTVNVTANGLYTFTLTSGGETITEMVSVSRLDAVAPTLTLREPGGADAVYNTLTFAADAADNLSGVKTVEYVVTSTGAVPSSGWATLAGSGGSYNGSYTETSAAKTTKYIHVRATDNAGNVTTKTSAAYTVVKENAAAAPIITLTGAPTNWTKGPVNLTWAVTNAGAGGITVYLNGTTSTATSGTLEATGNGLYSVSVTDQNGVSANASLLVDKIDAEAPILTGLSSPTGWGGSKTVTVTGVTDNRTPLPDASGMTTGYGGSGLAKQEWKLESGSYTTFSGNSFVVTATGTYTVRLTDNAGNTNEYETLVSQVDTTAPAVTVGTPAAGWTSGAQNIKVTYTDSESGIGAAEYKIVDNTTTKPTSGLSTLPASGGTISVSANGTNYIYYKVTDKVGNVKDGYSAAIMVDTAVPTLALSGGTNGILASNANGLQITVIRGFGVSGGEVQVYKGDTPTYKMKPEDVYFSITSGKGHFKVVATSNAGLSKTVEFDVFQINFTSNGTDTKKPQVVVDGGIASKPNASAPTHTGYTLTGWNKGGMDYDFTTPVISDITLDAVWTLDAPTVSLAVDKANVTYDGGNTVATLTATPRHTATGVTYTYEWYRDGTKINGATGSTLALTKVADSGSYTVNVTASDGALTSTQGASTAVAVAVNKANTEITTQPSARGITYGDTLSNSTLAGGAASRKDSSFFGRIASVFRNSEAVQGVFSWTDDSINPAVADSDTTNYSVTFTPTDTENYNTSTTRITLTVGRKTLTPSVKTVSDKAYDGNTDATGTVALTGAVLGELPTANGTFAFTNINATKNKSVNVTGITLAGTWGDNYALDKAELVNAATMAEITPKTIGLTWSGHTNLVYTGNPVNVTAAATGLINPDTCAVTVTGGTLINAGTYTATATAVSNANYKLPINVTQSYTIAKAPVTFTVTDNIHDYDRTAKTATVIQTAGETPSIADGFTVNYVKDGVPVATPTDVDVYDIFVELTDHNFKYKNETDTTRKIKVGTLTINGIKYPDADTMKWPAAEDITYGETLFDSPLTGGDQTDKGVYTWEAPATVPTVENSGYTVVFTPTDTNYEPVKHTITITVAKATPTLILPRAVGITYGETLGDSALIGGAATVDYNGVADTGVPGDYAWTAPDTKPVVADSDSTEYGLTFTPTDTDNYNVVNTGKIKLAVGTKTVGLDWHGDTDLVYTAGPMNVTAKATGLETGDSCAVTVTGGTETNAGTHTATATALDNSNYKLPTAVTHSYTIAKAPVTFAVTNNVYDYDSTAKAAAVTQTAGETPDVSNKFTVSYVKDGILVVSPTSMGVYNVLAELTDPNFKHKGKDDGTSKIQVGLLTINGIEYPKADTMTWPTAEDLTYGQKLDDSALTGGSESGAGTYTWITPDTVPTVQNDGYWVVFTPADINYSTVEKTLPIVVNKATPTLTLPTSAGITYGDTLVKSSLSGGSASAPYNGTPNTKVPGSYGWTEPATMPKVSDSSVTEYGLTFTPTDTDNYNVVTSGRVKLAVAQKPVSLTWAGHTALVYNGVPVSVTATATGLVGSDVCAVTVTNGSKTDAGDYTAKATAVSNPNYKLPTAAAQNYTIAKKSIKVLWSDLFPIYDGTAKTPTAALEGVIGNEDCTAVSTGSAAAGNAGRYRVAAALQGTRSGNYTMQNPNEILVVQPAPVSVSLSNYSHKYDGAAKYATVTATPDIPLTVTYRLAGNAVAAPTEEGIYDILVELNGKNYRFAEGTDSKARRIGALTIYKEKPPERYTITFAMGAEDAVGVAPTLPASVKDTVHILPSNSFLRAGYAFVGWKNGNITYQPGERFIQPANNNTVFTAQWEAATYDIGGVVDQDGKPIANVRVVLMRGAEQVAETVTNQIGEYHFNNVLPGLYNLVASKPSPDGVGDIIMTIMVEIKAADVEQANITLPSGKTNSIVEVAPGTPKIIVGNLDQTFKNTEGSDFTPADKEIVTKGGTVEIKFMAEEKQKSEIIGDAEEISKEAGNTKIGLYLALDVEKTVTQPTDPSTPDEEPASDTTPVPETSVLLESVIPLPSDLQGKQSYTVYRVHGGAVDTITTDADSGERIEVSEDKTKLTLYAQKFSTYAVAYTEKSSNGGADDGNDSDWEPEPDPIKPEQPTPAAPAVPTPETNVPNPAQPGTTQPDNQKADGADKENQGEEPSQKADGDNDSQKDDIHDALEDAINGLPDTLTDEQRQEYIDRLTAIADAAIAALGGTNDPDETKRIVQQAQKDMEKLATEALAFVGGTAKPFVLASAIFALVAFLLAAFALLKRTDKRRKLLSAVFAVLAVAAFLLTSGWSGFVLADWWTLVVAVFAIGAAISVFGWYSKERDEDTTAN